MEPRKKRILRLQKVAL